MMLIINRCKRSWSGSESCSTIHQDEKQADVKKLIKLHLCFINQHFQRSSFMKEEEEENLGTYRKNSLLIFLSHDKQFEKENV